MPGDGVGHPGIGGGRPETGNPRTRQTRTRGREGIVVGRLEGLTALVTGAGSGIGRATAIEFAREGADVVVHVHDDPADAAGTVRGVEEAGRRAVVVPADIGERDDVSRMFAAAADALGPLDILVNNAGVDASGTEVADLDPEASMALLRTNVLGPMMCCAHFVRQHRTARRRDGGRIINVTSVHEEIPRPGGADYDASKGALRSFTRTLALEVAGDGITVNNLAPGMILTAMNREAIEDEEALRRQTEAIPLGRAGRPEEVARVAVFLASADAAYVTGASVVIDGGLMRAVGQGA